MDKAKSKRNVQPVQAAGEPPVAQAEKPTEPSIQSARNLLKCVEFEQNVVVSPMVTRRSFTMLSDDQRLSIGQNSDSVLELCTYLGEKCVRVTVSNSSVHVPWHMVRSFKSFEDT